MISPAAMRRSTSLFERQLTDGRGAGCWRSPFVRCVGRRGTRQAMFRRKRLPSHGKPAELIAFDWRVGDNLTAARWAGVFLSLSARHAGIHVAPITTFRLWTARVKLVPEHQ